MCETIYKMTFILAIHLETLPCMKERNMTLSRHLTTPPQYPIVTPGALFL